jgi:hypothetical protein
LWELKKSAVDCHHSPRPIQIANRTRCAQGWTSPTKLGIHPLGFSTDLHSSTPPTSGANWYSGLSDGFMTFPSSPPFLHQRDTDKRENIKPEKKRLKFPTSRDRSRPSVEGSGCDYLCLLLRRMGLVPFVRRDLLHLFSAPDVHCRAVCQLAQRLKQTLSFVACQVNLQDSTNTSSIGRLRRVHRLCMIPWCTVALTWTLLVRERKAGEGVSGKRATASSSRVDTYQ